MAVCSFFFPQWVRRTASPHQIAEGIRSLAGSPEELSASLAWCGIACCSLQTYVDFSGYSDIAVGIGKMFGFIENLEFPYIAQSMRDFWRRWQLSVST